MVTRRGLLAGLLATGILPRLSWADAGNPAFLSAARRADGAHILAGISPTGDILFRLPLPGRGHAGAAHPTLPQALAFARRPGTFALVLNCVTGEQTARLDAPEGRHFYGHGAFSSDGSRLYTTENDYDAARGVIGIWDVAAGYRRIGEWDSHGIGPHELLCLPGSDTLVIANGGIETHPDSGRAKLNIPTMQPSLVYLSPEGALIDQLTLPPELHQNSIRHIAARADGTVAFAMQWQGSNTAHPPLLGLHRTGQPPQLLTAQDPDHRSLQGYAGSTAFSTDGTRVAITSPRGGLIQQFDTDGTFLSSLTAPDICGLGPGPDGFTATSGTGALYATQTLTLTQQATHPLAWDNHLTPIPA